jgi:ABC-type transport system involved in Fe-S cluster assembly fused permease/ATPase subunit
MNAADNIVVLSDDGTVEDSGTHADLMAAGGSTPTSGRNAFQQPVGRW